jgi:putative ABC transport system permease protein
VNTLLAHLRYTIRVLLKSPGFSITTILVLALGIAANTAIFSLFDAVLLRPLPYPDPDRLVKLWETFPNSGREYSPVSYPDYLDWRTAQRTFDDLSLFRLSDFNLTRTAIRNDSEEHTSRPAIAE